MKKSERVIRVLLVEDNPGDQALVHEVFATCSEEIELGCVDNGEEAHAVLSDPDYKPDLIIVDLNIPRIDGSQVMRFVKQTESRLRAVPAIVFSSFPYPHAAARSLFPADAFFTNLHRLTITLRSSGRSAGRGWNPLLADEETQCTRMVKSIQPKHATIVWS